MRSCSSHLSNKNVLSSFRNESKLNDGSFILAGRSFQIAGPQTLNDLGPKANRLYFSTDKFFCFNSKYFVLKAIPNSTRRVCSNCDLLFK